MRREEIARKLDIKKIKESKVARNSFFITAAHFMNIALGLLATTIIARYLGVELYGRFGYYTALMSILAIFLDLGTDIFSVVQISKDKESMDRYMSMNVTSRFFMTAVMSIVFICMGVSGAVDMEAAALIFWAAFLMQNFIKVPRICFQSSEEMHYMALYDVLDYVLLLICTSAFVLMGPKGIKLELVAGAYLVSRGLTVVMSMNKAIRRYKLKYVKVRASEVLDLVKKSSPLFVNSIITLLAMQIDVMMINAFMGDIETGYYSASKRILTNLLIFPSVMTTVLLPKLSNKSLDEQKSFYVLKMNFAGGIIVAAGIFIFAKLGILLLFGRDYLPAYQILQIFGFAMPMLFVNYYLGTYLVANEKQSKVLFLNIISTLANIGMNYVLIPAYQGRGAAMATFISISIGFVISIYHYMKTRRENDRGESISG